MGSSGRATSTCRRRLSGCIFRTDRGMRYASTQCRELLPAHRMVGPLRRDGKLSDNARAESIVKTPKLEAEHLADHNAFEDVSDDLPDASRRSTTTPASCTLRLGIRVRSSARISTLSCLPESRPKSDDCLTAQPLGYLGITAEREPAHTIPVRLVDDRLV